MQSNARVEIHELVPPVLVPEPPALELRPTSDRAVVTVVNGEEAERCHAVSGPYLRAYAERIGADFVVCRWPGHPDWPISAKFGAMRVLDHYKRMAYFDADVLVRPNAVNVFDHCEADEFGACDELPFHIAQPQHQRMYGYQLFRRDLGFKNVPNLPFYLNMGVYVAPKCYQRLLTPPTTPIWSSHCCEQDWINARLLDGKARVRLLDRRCNWQNWSDHGFKAAPADAILHWSGAWKDRAERHVMMQEMADRFPLAANTYSPDDYGPWEWHDWQIDERHARWINRVLMTGRYRRVLEIGTFRGYSATAMLAALRAGTVDAVHLCDIEYQRELGRLACQFADVWPRVHFHLCRSADLLHRDSAFDLVFIDGDHQIETVREESELILAAGIPAVFAHDVWASARGWQGHEGAAHLPDQFKSAGYALCDDSIPRPGEMTHRGMMFASLARREVPPCP